MSCEKCKKVENYNGTFVCGIWKKARPYGGKAVKIIKHGSVWADKCSYYEDVSFLSSTVRKHPFFLEKAKAVAYLIENELAERHSADPENGFYGKQTWIEPTDGSHVLIYRATGAEYGPGEVRPICSISVDGETIWAEPEEYVVEKKIGENVYYLDSDNHWVLRPWAAGFGCFSTAKLDSDLHGGYVVPVYRE